MIIKTKIFAGVLITSFALTLVFILMNVTEISADSHHEGHIFPENGWVAIAEGDEITWAMDPDTPTTSVDGFNIRENMRAAMDAWNYQRSYSTDMFASETVDFETAEFKYAFCLADCLGTNTHLLDGTAEMGCESEWSWGEDDPICGAVSSLNVNWQPAMGETGFQGSLAHEMGHAFGLQHPAADSCESVMGGCWNYRTGPGPFDKASLDKIYGIPHSVSVAAAGDWSITGSAVDLSSFESHYNFDLWKWDTSTDEWDFVHTNTATADQYGDVSFTEDLTSQGCGSFLFGIEAHNTYVYPTATIDTDQFGGFTDSIYVCDINVGIVRAAADSATIGGVFSNSSYLSAGESSGSSQQSWMRFEDLTIPQGSIITSAGITLTITGDGGHQNKANVHTRLAGHAASNPSDPSSAGDLGSKAETSAHVRWYGNEFPTGTDTADSPDLSSVVQELVDNYDYSSGRDMAFLWRKGATSADDAWVNVDSIDTAPSATSTPDAPALSITFVAPIEASYSVINQANDGEAQVAFDAEAHLSVGNASGIYDHQSWLRFPDITIPQGATITEASITLTVSGGEDTHPNKDDVHSMLMAHFQQTPSDPTSAGTLDEKDVWGSEEFVVWEGSDFPASSGTADSPDLSAVIQELIDATKTIDYSSGGEIAFMWLPGTSTADNSWINADSYDLSPSGGSSTAPALHIGYDTATTSVDIDVSIATTTADSYAKVHYSNDSYLTAGNTTTSIDRASQIKFIGVRIPENAVITSASLTFTVTGTAGHRNKSSASTTLAAEDNSDGVHDPSSLMFDRPTTTASVKWEGSSFPDSNGTAVSPDIKDVIQELVDTYDYSAGRDIALLWLKGATSSNDAWVNVDSLDSTPSGGGTPVSPKLNFTYYVPLPPPTTRNVQDYSTASQAEDGGKNGGDYNDNIFLAQGSWGVYRKETWVRFPTVTIDANATIISAYLVFTVSETYYQANSSPASNRIRGNDTGTPTDPTSSSGYDSLARTTAKANSWYDSAGNTPHTAVTPDLTTVIQELVDSYDYSSGRDMAFIIDYEGGLSNKTANYDSYDVNSKGDTSPAPVPPRLHIEYDS